MAKKGLLEALIESLNQSELKRFTLYTKTYASNKSYMELFKAIRSHKHKKPEKYSNKYAQQRRYLYRIILESLIQKSDKSIENEVLFFIKAANYLLKKQLAENAYQMVNKALSIVTKYEMIGFHLEVIEIEKQIRIYMNPPGHRSDAEIMKEEMDLLEQQKQLQVLKIAHNHILNYKKRFGYIDDSRWNILRKEVRDMGFIDEVKNCYTQKAQYYFYYNQALLNWIKHNHTEAYEHTSNLIKIKPEPLTKQEYLNALLEHSSSCYCLGKTNEILSTLSRVQDLHKKGVFGKFENITLKIFYYRSNYELSAYVFMGQEENVKKKLLEIEEGMAHWDDKIPLAMKMILATGLKLGYLATGEFKKMAKEINFLVNNYKSGLRLDAFEDGLMWQLIYTYMKDDMDFLEKQAKYAYKHFSNKQNKDDQDVKFKIDTSRLFLEYSQSLWSKREFLLKFKNLLDTKLSHFNNHFSEIDYPYLIWVNSQISGKPFLDAAYEMSHQYLNK